MNLLPTQTVAVRKILENKFRPATDLQIQEAVDEIASALSIAGQSLAPALDTYSKIMQDLSEKAVRFERLKKEHLDSGGSPLLSPSIVYQYKTRQDFVTHELASCLEIPHLALTTALLRWFLTSEKNIFVVTDTSELMDQVYPKDLDSDSWEMRGNLRGASSQGGRGAIRYPIGAGELIRNVHTVVVLYTEENQEVLQRILPTLGGSDCDMTVKQVHLKLVLKK